MSATFFAPLGDIKKTTDEVTTNQFFINFINQLEGWKTKCKNLHWAAPKKNIHEYLDAFLEIISNYQDSLAEGYMGILGKMQPNAIKGVACDCLNATDFIAEVKINTIDFYNGIPKDTLYKGITSDCEAFIQNINKYDYLFSLCDVRLY
jgi:hypothetical protein